SVTLTRCEAGSHRDSGAGNNPAIATFRQLRSIRFSCYINPPIQTVLTSMARPIYRLWFTVVL
ncbi:hypothetical protein, partial [Providencia hangzhouensis]